MTSGTPANGEQVTTDSENVTRRLVVDADQGGLRLDRYVVAALQDLSRQRIQALIASGDVTVDGVAARSASLRLKPGQEIVVAVPAPVPASPIAETISLSIVYEDDDIIVVDKPAGMVTHPAPGNETGTLVNALLGHFGDRLSGIGGVKRPGIVHRLDKDTSGLLVVAKTDAAHQGLAEQFAAHGADGRLERAYLALVWGELDRKRGRVEARLGRSQANRRKMAVVKGEYGRHAATRYAVEQVFAFDGKPLVSLLRLELETGRTHQIRVHMSLIGHPLLGDATYGASHRASARRLPEHARDALEHLGRQALHAAVLGFEHPVTGAAMRFESELPADLAELICALRNAA
jgi:23S rRNA pseudouridine1911/1915/1917 synthase